MAVTSTSFFISPSLSLPSLSLPLPLSSPPSLSPSLSLPLPLSPPPSSRKCQEDDWSKHRKKCNELLTNLEGVGIPFIISLPITQLTFDNIADRAEKYAKYFILLLMLLLFNVVVGLLIAKDIQMLLIQQLVIMDLPHLFSLI